MHPTKRQVKYYIFYCITQLIIWFCWASDWRFYDYPHWCGLHSGDYITFTSAVAVPFLLGLLIFSILFLPFYLRKEE